MNLQLGGQQPPHDPAALARDILTQPRFRMFVTGTRPHTWWDSVRQWIADRWNQLLDAFSHHVHLGKWSAASGDVIIALIIVLVIFFAVRLLLRMAHEAPAVGSLRVSALGAPADAAELHAAALAAAQQGAYPIAMALLFQAALAVLDVRGLLRDDPARTVNECRSDVRRRAAQFSAPFDRIARLFTAAVYAEDRMTAAQWSDALDAYAAFAALQRDAA